MTWIGKLQPTLLSETYTVQIRYQIDKRPHVTVLDPQLQRRNGSRLPHVFTGDELCLFRYAYSEWDGSMFLADTIIPWTSLWLFHYEIWSVTGIWCGSRQEHPSGTEEKKTSE